MIKKKYVSTKLKLVKTNFTTSKFSIWSEKELFLSIYLLNFRKVIGHLQTRGLTFLGFNILLSFFYILKREFKRDAYSLILKNFLRISPLFFFLGRYVSGRKVLVPVRLRLTRALALVWSNFLLNASLRSESTMLLKMLGEFKDVSVNRGATVKFFEEHTKQVKEFKFNYYMLKKYFR